MVRLTPPPPLPDSPATSRTPDERLAEVRDLIAAAKRHFGVDDQGLAAILAVGGPQARPPDEIRNYFALHVGLPREFRLRPSLFEHPRYSR